MVNTALLVLLSISSIASMTRAALTISRDAPDKALLSCFEFHANYWMMGFAFHTVNIEFKDDCLRHCLTSQMRGGEACRSAMHIPNDQECVLAEQGRVDRPDLFVENDQRAFISVNYYENKCAHAPVKGGQVSAKLQGFKSGTGVVEMVQDVKSRQAYVLTVVADLEANEQYAIHYKHIDDGCSTVIGQKHLETDETTKLVELTTDHTGMAVRPWEQLLVDIYGSNSPLNKTLLLLHSRTKEIVDCGFVRSVGNFSDFVSQANSSDRRFCNNIIALFTALLIVMTTLLIH